MHGNPLHVGLKTRCKQPLITFYSACIDAGRNFLKAAVSRERLTGVEQFFEIVCILPAGPADPEFYIQISAAGLGACADLTDGEARYL